MGKFYFVCALLQNLNTCLHGNIVFILIYIQQAYNNTVCKLHFLNVKSHMRKVFAESI